MNSQLSQKTVYHVSNLQDSFVILSAMSIFTQKCNIPLSPTTNLWVVGVDNCIEGNSESCP